ncbi:hypothetical protein EZV62_007200 [Acer yangbiense]|uniref:Reverse transcriptase Ty1/copia-type domain-containing protein n=1 Tax=Acer yangbiense TaxID=1000413 RepID=A0A5C7I9M9_9ROSI|nr:hypothetical protein EZV62_007200 [Acer yangbiense]
MAAARGWSLHQMDINNAFLHGDLVEEIYMSPSLGLRRQGEEDLVCRLHKSLYGLKQASRQWFANGSPSFQMLFVPLVLCNLGLTTPYSPEHKASPLLLS